MNTNTKKIATILGISIFFVLILGYAFFVSRKVIFGVKITNVSINGASADSYLTLKENIVKITGTANNAINLTLDGREISIDQAGHFNETIALLLGYNIISIKAQDKFGLTDEKNYKIIFQP